MVIIERGLSEWDDISCIKDDMEVITISSNDKSVCSLMLHIINNVFSHSKKIFKATGLLENLEELSHRFEQSTVVIYPGSRGLLFIKNMAELHSTIRGMNDLLTVLHGWSRVIYERRFIYIPKDGDMQNIYNSMKDNLYLEVDDLCNVWDSTDCMIRNNRESEYEYSFLIVTRKQFLTAIENIIITKKGN